ncbi:MAG TPA: hypothetical protein VEV15_11555, partial [Flavisolibacter sp.]|nr:hypothetical protein [Flavisolibacter sp.]
MRLKKRKKAWERWKLRLQNSTLVFPAIKSFMFRLLIVLAITVSLKGFSQINSQKLDSLSSAIDSKNQSLKAWQDSFQKSQDSIYKEQTTAKSGLSNDGNAIEKERRLQQKKR